MRNSAFSFTIWFFTITLLRHNVFRRNDFQSFRVFYRHFLIWFPVLEIFFHEAQLFTHSYTHVPAVFILSRQIIGFLVNCFTPFSSFDSVLQTNPVCFFFFTVPACGRIVHTHTSAVMVRSTRIVTGSRLRVNSSLAKRNRRLLAEMKRNSGAVQVQCAC